VHTCKGQEILPVIFQEHLTKKDFILSNHRGHGHFISWTNDIEKLDSPMIEHLKRKNIFLDSFEKECFEDEFYIDTVSVSTSFQGRGIAKELFSFAEQKAKELDLKKLSLLVDFENPKAKALYERLGFKDNEILKVSGSNFYHMIKQLDL
ncbi:MAG: GNAT family N-acetyltransferase, partial [Aliarcobacter cryaerophilus]